MIKGFSIVICCYNSAARLPKTLQSIANITMPENQYLELVIIDNASTDNTVSVAKDLWEKYQSPFPIKISHEPNPGLSYARTLGIQESTCEYILFCDDDNWLDKNYLLIANRILDNYPNVGLLGGMGEAIADGEIPEWTRIFQLFGCGPQAKESGITPVLYGAGLVLKKSAYTQLVKANFRFQLTDRKKGQLTSGGDYELCYAVRMAGYELRYDESMKFKHYIPHSRLTIKYYTRYIKESGYSEDILNIYAYLLQKPNLSFLEYQLKRIWQFLYHIKCVLVFSIKLWYHYTFNRKNLIVHKLHFKYQRTRTLQIFNHFLVMRKKFNTIKKLQQSLQQIS